MTNNSSKTIQKTKISVICGQRLTSLTIENLEKMKSDRDFNIFYELITNKASAISGNGNPELAKRQNKLKYFADGREASSLAHQQFKVIYFEAVDSIVSAVKDQFKQPSFNLFSDINQLMLKSINGEDCQQKLDNFVGNLWR